MELNLLENKLIELKKEYEREIISNIKILNIIQEEITKPKMDGTPGCALYKIPLKLSETPSNLWEEVFLQNWKNPSSFSSMHRPNIASINKNNLILDGTTLEEIENYHKKTLLECIEKTNQYVEIYTKQKIEKEINELKKEIDFYLICRKKAELIKF